MKKLLAAIVLAAMAAAALLVPLPLFVLAPGGAVPIPEHIDVESPPGDITGDLLLTTVELRRATAVGTVFAALDDTLDVVSRNEVIPEGTDTGEYLEAQQRLFQESARVAVAVGARAAGRDVVVSGRGAEIAAVLPGGPAEGKLRTGDAIVAVGDETIEVASDLLSVTGRSEVGDTLRLTIVRDGDRRDVDVGLARLSEVERPAIGIAIRTRDLSIELPFEVEVDAGRIGGPSAGLMIALAAYDLLGDADLTRGRTVAGTGTIELGGRVGPVGGIPQKVEAARDAGADVFLVAEQHADEARSVAGGLPVIAVATIDEAVSALLESDPPRR